MGILDSIYRGIMGNQPNQNTQFNQLGQAAQQAQLNTHSNATGHTISGGNGVDFMTGADYANRQAAIDSNTNDRNFPTTNLASAPKTDNTQNTPYTPSTGSGNYNYADYWQEQQAQQQAAQAAALQAAQQARLAQINAMNAALDKQADAEAQRLNGTKDTIRADYTNYRNQNSVNQYKTARNQREMLANRGALDQGVGRQEQLNMNTAFGNILNTINMKEAADIANVDNAINKLYADRDEKKATNMSNGLNDFTSALYSLIQSDYSGYTPEGSNYFQDAVKLLGNGLINSATGTQAATNNTDDVYTQLLRMMRG